MSNILNNYIANRPLNENLKQKSSTFYDIKDNVKPMEYKGELLPSRIIGSPVEYAKDLGKDIVSIGKAAKGEANDFELGRINDLAMKLGSLGLAGYLFVKNPLKLNKVMEFVGFGTFFASMALWPKIAIQAPLKARTGVDIHQKYVDSQGRKKMLHQDAQYDLTDLYSREDLDKMGEKMGISEDMPDRDNFIKQRAKKTAVQGNTLWMMTAGFASPVMSALACNRLEKPINNAIERSTLKRTEFDLYTKKHQGFLDKLKQQFSEKSFARFLDKNADSPLDDKMIDKISSKLETKIGSAYMKSGVSDCIKSMIPDTVIDEEFVKKALKGKIPESTFNNLTEQQRKALDTAMQNKSFSGIANVLSQTGDMPKSARKKLSGEIVNALNSGKSAMKAENAKVSDVSGKIKTLYSSISDFSRDRKILGRYINARVGDQSGTYIANQWNRVSSKILKSLNLNRKELKAVSEGNTEIIADKLKSLVSDEAKFDKTVKQLMDLVNDYDDKTGSKFIEKVQSNSSKICTGASNRLKENNFVSLANKISAEGQKETLENFINLNAAERAKGAQSSFYRLIHSLDIFKQIQDNSLKTKITNLLKENKEYVNPENIDQIADKLTKVCQDVVMDAKVTDYVEKLTTSNYNLSEVEYKTVMQALFDNSASTTIEKSIAKQTGANKAKTIMSGFKKYKEEVTSKLGDWQNGMTPRLARRNVTGNITRCQNAVERANLTGSTVNDLIINTAKQTYNSQKWLKIFGGTMIALTAVTLGTGLVLGRKSNMEKQAEKENKVQNDQLH